MGLRQTDSWCCFFSASTVDGISRLMSPHADLTIFHHLEYGPSHCTRTGSSFPLESGLIFFSMLANSLNNPFQIFCLGYILLVEKDLTQDPLWVMNNACTAWFHYYPRVYCSHHSTEGIALFLHKCCLVLGIRVWGKPFVFGCSFVSLKCGIVSFSL